jgi:hypothetical protein
LRLQGATHFGFGALCFVTKCATQKSANALGLACGQFLSNEVASLPRAEVSQRGFFFHSEERLN